jgi:tetratricopeptide (TPR) repeat protein
MMNEQERKHASLRRQLAETAENLRLIRERKSQYVMETDVPLQLIKMEIRLEGKIADLKKRLAQLEKADTEIGRQPDGLSVVASYYVDKDLVAAHSIRDATGRAKALSKLIPHLPTPARYEVLQEALTAARDIRDAGTRADVLTTLVSHSSETIRATTDRAGKAAILSILGSIHADLGDTSRAVSCYEQVLMLVQEIGDRQAEGEVLSNLGLAYAALGDFPRAIEQYEQAILIAHQLGDRYAEAIRLQNLGLVFLRRADSEPDRHTGHLSQAADAFQQALNLFEVIEAAPLLRARTRYHLGRCYSQLGRWGEAITLLEQARETFSRHKTRPELAHTLLELGQLYGQMQDFESAYIYLKDALRLFRRLGDTDGIAVTQEALGNLALQTARPEEAIAALQDARQGYASLRRDERVHAVDDLLRIARQACQAVGGTTP